jgi:histidinol phosphatase-like PHP family hydrolase
MVFDFHTHTFLSDGSLLPIELIRRAIARGHQAIGLTDHVSLSNLAHVIEALTEDCRLAEKHWGVRAIPGVELTHIPPAVIPELAAEARRRGAQLIVVHGETPVEPVPEGTNLASARCPEVDILAHPGAIDVEIARLAAENNVFLELSARKGHCLANGAVAAAARAAGALLLVNSDAHDPPDLLTAELGGRVAAGAGLPPEECQQALITNARALIDRLSG